MPKEENSLVDDENREEITEGDSLKLLVKKAKDYLDLSKVDIATPY